MQARECQFDRQRERQRSAGLDKHAHPADVIHFAALQMEPMCMHIDLGMTCVATGIVTSVSRSRSCIVPAEKTHVGSIQLDS